MEGVDTVAATPRRHSQTNMPHGYGWGQVPVRCDADSALVAVGPAVSNHWRGAYGGNGQGRDVDSRDDLQLASRVEEVGGCPNLPLKGGAGREVAAPVVVIVVAQREDVVLPYLRACKRDSVWCD